MPFKIISKASALRREIQNKIRKIGIVETIKSGATKLIGEMGALVFLKKQGLHPFDIKYGTDTSGIIKPEALDIPDDKIMHAVRYQTAIVDVFFDALKSLPIDFEEFLFVDLGSGKGRALLLASEYPFKAIWGVELSLSLQAIANRNIQIYKSESQRCHLVQSICEDVTKFQIPKEKIVFYLFNPFDDHVMCTVARNIEDSLQEYFRDIYIVYLKPVHRNIFDQAAFLNITVETERYVIYKSRAALLLNSNAKKHHICVCICTYKRPKMLHKLLLKLEEQVTDGLFDYSIVIVDNDKSESARQTAIYYSLKSKISTSYYVEPEQNIALARNKTIENAKGDFVALIDDDEFPVGNWLLKLYKALECYDTSGILGPVLPFFEKQPPIWILKGRIFDRPTHRTGYILESKNTRTGNVLIKRDVFQENDKWFDPKFGSGGEDRDFFRRKIAEGHVFRWCNEAPVFETVPPDRWEINIMLKRALLRGQLNYINTESTKVRVLKSAVAIAFYTSCLPVFFFLGKHIYLNYIIKICDHFGKVSSFLGVNLIKDKYFG